MPARIFWKLWLSLAVGSSIAVYSAVRVIAESIAALPVHLYRRDGRSRVLVEDDREHLLSVEANEFLSAPAMWETVLGHALLWGNGYVYRSYDAQGRADGLWPLDPRSTAPYRTEDGRLFYGTNIGGESYAFEASDVMHVRGFGTGDVGLSPIGVAREALGEQSAATAYAECAGVVWRQFVTTTPAGVATERIE